MHDYQIKKIVKKQQNKPNEYENIYSITQKGWG